ncbi:hypothetical protein V1517DRAFT_329556 [Lipomyces orientalis]|uniref:Uncharacterized protein n=1 Tax=Lipomyces orientalis TaxID=1233043 RepID=A0ACC3THQ0_9ASCO
MIKDGCPHYDLPDSLGLRIRDFYPPDVWEREAGNIEDRARHFDSAGFLDEVMDGVTVSAKYRFEELLFDKLKLR